MPAERWAGSTCAVTLLLVSIVVGCAVAGCATSRAADRQPVVEKLDVKGNHVLSDSGIEKKILTTATGWWPFATKHFFDPVVWATDLERIKRLYGSLGFYQAEVIGDRVTPRPPHGVALEVEVREGEVTRISTVEVTGLDELPSAERATLVDALGLRPEDPFQEGRWAAAKAGLRDRLRDQGYAEAEVEGAALIDVATRSAQLTLAVRLGERFRFGAIEVDTGGESTIAAAWIWDQVRLAVPEGELYSSDAMVEAQRRVADMGVFAAVKVSTGAPDRATHLIPIHVETREAPLRTLKLGGGVRIDQIRNETRLIAEWTNRNFRGGMRRLNLRGEVGWAFIPNTYAVVTNDQSTEVRNGLIARLRLEFEQPRFLGRPSLTERSSAEMTRTLEQAYDDLGGAVANGVVWRPRASLTIYPSHHLQGDQLNGPAGAAALTSPLTLGCHATGNSCFVWLSYLEEIVTWDRRDNALEPRRGWYASLSLQQGGGPLLGDFKYYRVLPELRGYASFGEDDELTVAGRLRVGELVPASGNAQDSAVVTRFYAGGAQSMRGFNDRRLSPLLLSPLPASPGNPNPPPATECRSSSECVTLPVGGDGLVDGSLEVRYRLSSNLVVAAFVDFGQVTLGPLQMDDFPHVLVAAGFGLRYLTPVGPVRVDFGRRLPVGRPPPLFVVGDDGRLTEQRYDVDDSCFGLGGSSRGSLVTDNLCALHISIGEAF